MTEKAFVLVLLSVILHTAWNHASKRLEPTVALFAWSNAWGVLVLLPILFVFRSEVSQLPATVGWLLVLTVFVRRSTSSRFAK